MSTPRDPVIIGTFQSAIDARRAIEDLRDAHFSDRKIGVLAHDKEGDAVVKSFREMEGTKAAAGAAVGVAAGVGGGALWALGIAAGFLPAIGPVIAGGLLAAIAASAASGAAAGALVGTLIGLGVTDEQAAYYDAEFRKGHTILVVEADDRVALARTILRAHNGVGQEVAGRTLAQQIDQRYA